MALYSWKTIEQAGEEYDALDEAVDTLVRVIDDLKDAPNQETLVESLQDLVDQSRMRLDDLAEIVRYGEQLEAEDMNREYERDCV